MSVSLTERTLRTSLLWASRQASLGRLMSRAPGTRVLVRRFVSGENVAEALVAVAALRAIGLLTSA